MNGSPSTQNTASFIGVLGAFLIVAVLVSAMKYYTQPAPPDQARIAERKNALAELRGESQRALNTYEVIDPAKGVVRLKIERAMELTIEEYKNPVAARTNMFARVEKLNAPPPKVEYE